LELRNNSLKVLRGDRCYFDIDCLLKAQLKPKNGLIRYDRRQFIYIVLSYSLNHSNIRIKLFSNLINSI
jgi:hypothetical protein